MLSSLLRISLCLHLLGNVVNDDWRPVLGAVVLYKWTENALSRRLPLVACAHSVEHSLLHGVPRSSAQVRSLLAQLPQKVVE